MSAMNVILGATGHVGSAVASELLARGEPVTVVTRNAGRGAQWSARGASVARTDVHDVDALSALFRQGGRLFLLNPPAAPSTDTVTEERASLACILQALSGSGIERIVAESTYGAQPAERAGDLGVLYDMEQALSAQPPQDSAGRPIASVVIRAAYYMSNWDAALATARHDRQVHTLYPVDFCLPMVAPGDIGRLAARLMMESPDAIGLHYIEGPERYCANDVAAAFAAALDTPVEAVETPEDQWPQALASMGFSKPAADAFADMTRLTLNAQCPTPDVRGRTTLGDYVSALVKGA